MQKYNKIRWNRLIKLEISVDYTKSIIKKIYNYEIKENSLEEIRDNISKYNSIDEFELLNLLEQNSYDKISIFYCRRYKTNKSEPLFEDLSNDIFINLFKKKNNINMKNQEYYKGDLGCCFKITYCTKTDTNFVIIKMAKVIERDFTRESNLGGIEEYTEELYDCAKFIIDLNKKIIFMFYNDFRGTDNSYEKEITLKKDAFRNMFSAVSKKNLLKYNIDNKLESYFKEYMDELRKKEPRKLISIIQNFGENNGKKSSLKSIQHDFNHDPKRLDTIEYEINNKGYIISDIECVINGNTININNLGEITCETSLFNKEVVKSVCEEFFNGYELSTYI